mgnify:CR=1 FL=1
MSTPVPGVLSRRSHRRCARIRCAPPVARNGQPQLSCRQSQEPHLHAEHDAPVHGHGRDQAVPGPADSLEGRQGGRPGQALPAACGRSSRCTTTRVPVLAAHRGGDHRALHAEARQHLRPLGCTVLHLAGPIELRRCRFGCAILGLGQAADPPSADPLRDVDMSLLQRPTGAGVPQNTPYAAMT